MRTRKKPTPYIDVNENLMRLLCCCWISFNSQPCKKKGAIYPECKQWTLCSGYGTRLASFLDYFMGNFEDHVLCILIETPVKVSFPNISLFLFISRLLLAVLLLVLAVTTAVSTHKQNCCWIIMMKRGGRLTTHLGWYWTSHFDRVTLGWTSRQRWPFRDVNKPLDVTLNTDIFLNEGSLLFFYITQVNLVVCYLPL